METTLSSSASSSSSAAWTAAADCELADYSRSIGAPLAVITTQGGRDAAGIDGRRHTDLDRDEIAA